MLEWNQSGSIWRSYQLNNRLHGTPAGLETKGIVDRWSSSKWAVQILLTNRNPWGTTLETRLDRTQTLSMVISTSALPKFWGSFSCSHALSSRTFFYISNLLLLSKLRRHFFLLCSSQCGQVYLHVCQRAFPSWVIHEGLGPTETPVFIAKNIFISEWYQGFQKQVWM